TSLLEAAYNDLSTFTAQEDVYSLFDHSSDEMIPPTRGVDWGDNGVWRLLHTHNWDATHAYVLNSWNILNQRSFNTNVIIASSPSAQQEAEARFLRAFHMWHIMDLYGVVPVREVTDGVDANPRVMSRTEAFDFIVADLEAAIPNLPSAGPSNGNVTANKAAAQALLARAFLNRAVYAQPLESASGPYTFDNADMQRVIDAADAIAAEGYSLNPSFFDVFSDSESNETILSSRQGSPQNRWNMTLHYSQNPSGWNGFTTLADFYNSFEATDIRRGAESPEGSGADFHGIKLGFLIGEQEDDNDVTVIDDRTNIPLSFTESVPLSGAPTAAGIRVIKYHPSRPDTKYILLRFADVHLMKAEAMFRMG
ncbi:MAG: RagB/SusD family nutrient uptake outer membrane protein, partial [Bacteroidota bacterium]